uniref:FGGY_N domain-containing protein n=1 Tax=Rhabditophanes sp. KR3021 TaxID=114890 RepID=A0AC35TLT0_9BILA
MIVLGIDIGTSSIKICLYDTAKECIIHSSSKNHDAHIKGLNPHYHEQEPKTILECLFTLINEIQIPSLDLIRIAGQMHGIVFWNSSTLKVSTLITWMDQRCDKNFLESLNTPYNLSTGYGCATLAWLYKHKRDLLSDFTNCGTVMDYIVCCLSQNFSNVFMSDQNAKSFGCYNDKYECFELPFLCPSLQNMMPAIVKSDYIVGTTLNTNIIDGVNIMVSIGDLQASLSVIPIDTKAAFISIGTSAQISFLSTNSVLNLGQRRCLILNHFINSYKCWTGAAINGGNSLSSFINMIVNLNGQVSRIPNNNLNDDTSQLWGQLLDCNKDKSSVTCDSLFLPERILDNCHDGASFRGIKEDTTLQEIFIGIASKVVLQLNDMMSEQFLLEMGINKVYLVGKAARPLFMIQIRKCYPNIELITEDTLKNNIKFDAACGAALFDKNIII